MNVIHLARAQIRGNKSAAASLFLLILIAALLLNTGLAILTQIQTFYDNKVAELNDAHVSVFTRSAEHGREYADFFRGYAGIDKTASEAVLQLEGAMFKYGDNEITITTVLANADSNRGVSPLKLVEKLASGGGDNDIFLPYSFKAGGHYALGQTFALNYAEREYRLRVAGFFEATMLGTTNNGMLKMMLPAASYRSLAAELGSPAEGTQVSAVLKSIADSNALLNDFNVRFSGKSADGGSSYRVMDIQSAKNASTITVNIVAMILVAFALVMVAVSLIVIKFQVTNGIEDGMVRIGILKAVGYTSGQILSSVVLQFMLITLSAGLLGVGLSQLVMPLFGDVIASLSGLLWAQSFDLPIAAASIVTVAVLVLSITGINAWRIRRLAPVSALRGGITTHSFRKNHFPLESARGGLHFLLACKTMLANRKQNLTIALIMAAVTFASVFSIVLHYNIAEDETAFVHLIGVEAADVIVTAKPETDSRKLLAEIAGLEGVEQVLPLDLIDAKMDGRTYYTNVAADYSQLKNSTVFEGRYPKYDNEAAVSWLIAEQLGKSIGDSVEVTIGNVSRPYLITGISQSINNMGLEASLTSAGVQQHLPEYASAMLYVYLDEADNAGFIASVKQRFSSEITEIMDFEETLQSQISVYTTVVFAVMLLVLAVTALVVALILYLLIHTMILKRKRELGILRANGFTTLQLMNQIALSFIPVVAVGVAIGCMSGYLYTNSLLELLLSGAGIRNVQFTIDPARILALSGGMIMTAYAVSMLVSRRIRRISAYGLITE